MSRRLIASLVTGALLGVVCIVGGSLRAGGFAGNELFFFAMWYNRVVMGLVIGLAADLRLVQGPTNRYVRGAVLGLVVTTAVFLSTAFRDVPAFFAGIFYGVIIEAVAQRFE
ncbi:MAG: hypothetical protein GX605_13680 [Chloroflexi bacterium]|nr:hypothetical protein [Chloroflexota bacterium]